MQHVLLGNKNVFHYDGSNNLFMNKTLISPLRYPGSKHRLVNYIQQVLTLNNLKPKLYIEPFAGGSSIALGLMQAEQVKKVILMDVDPWVASFWEELFFDTDWLIDQIRSIPITLEQWTQFKNGHPTDKRTQAITCFFLNRTSFSGILEKRVGPLGGREQKSEYSIDCRFPREKLVQRVLEIAHHREKIIGVWNCSWEEGITRIRLYQQQKKLPSEDLFFYFDPPFFEKAKELYRFFFQENDHIQLRNFVLALEDSWLLSYDSAKQVEQLYGDAIHNKTNGASRRHVDIYYSLAVMPERRKVKEVIISNLRNLPDLSLDGNEVLHLHNQPKLL
jgi:DNA adenine methylase